MITPRSFPQLIFRLVVVSIILSNCTSRPFINDQARTFFPEPTLTPVFTAPLPSLTRSPTVFIPSITPTIPPPIVTQMPTASSPNPQAEESIPACQNGEDPKSIADLTNLPGTILYTNKTRDRLFTLHGHPAQSIEMRLPAPGINQFAFSKNNTWFLAYAYNPREIQNSGRYPVWLISKEGEMSEIDLDMSAMNLAAVHMFSDLVSLQRWNFAWVNDQIVRVVAEYGERPEGGFGNNLYGFYDISTRTWWEKPLQNLPDRLPFSWIDASPDLSYLFYVDKGFDLVDWSLNQQRSVWRESIGPFMQIPPFSRWSNDSQTVMFNTPSEHGKLFLLMEGGGNQRSVRELIFSSSQKQVVSLI